MLARVIVLAGPSGSGKSRLAWRLGLPVLRLDDFYRDGDDPDLPRMDIGVVDWDDARSWDHDRARAAIDSLCRAGRIDVPIYDIAADRHVGSRELAGWSRSGADSPGTCASTASRWASWSVVACSCFAPSRRPSSAPWTRAASH